METLHKQTIISAVVLIALSLVAATPIPVPVTGSEPGVVPLGLLNDKIPLRTIGLIATLPHAVDSDDEPGLRARESTNTEKKQRKTTLITIPPGFLPGEIDSDLQMALPSFTELNWWGSVIHTISLMNAAAKQNPKLRTELHAFEVEMKKKAHGHSVENIISTLRRTRPIVLPTQAMAELNLYLETIQDHIKAVEKHNEFEGEVQIPSGFLPGTTKLGIKIPHPKNMEALKSVEFILKLMESALSRDKPEQAIRLRSFKHSITAGRFKLVLHKLPRKFLVEHLKDKDLHAIQGKIMEAVEKHNDNYWWYDDIPNDDPNKRPCPRYRETRITIPIAYFVPSHTHMYVPLTHDDAGTASVNNILKLMANVGGDTRMRASWSKFRDVLAEKHGLQVVPQPRHWGTDGIGATGTAKITKEEENIRRLAVSAAVRKHNAELILRYGKACQAGPGKRKADGFDIETGGEPRNGP